MTERALISAHEIAAAIGQFPPTPEQRAVIESPLEPALVVAGAGSGKTETMAARVLWLLANDLVRPTEILGLTFTRKAAGELAERIRTRIDQLERAGLMAAPGDPFDVPAVSTYNAYANALFRDNAAVLGREADGAVLGEAAAWQLARRVVLASRDERLPGLDRGVEAVTGAVLNVARALAENVADPEAVRDYARELQSVLELPSTAQYPAVVKAVTDVGALDVLLDLAADLDELKRRRGLVEFSDQVALGLEIVRRRPEIADAEKASYRVVLLDEYQDTSVTQTRLLAQLFSGHPVMAVGDPNQSIYGWRGASASNLDEFPSAFGARGDRYALSTSWRNGVRVLDAANALVAPFAGAHVERLTPSPAASSEPVEVAFTEDVLAEAEAAADWLAERLAQRSSAGVPPSAAMLFRTRKTQGMFLDALRRRDIPFHVLGIGGLLAEPEIADLVSALAVVDDPGAGLELVRLLAGSRWRIGVQDLERLRALASWLHKRDYAQKQLDDEVREAMRASVAPGEGGSIVDALDFLVAAREGHVALEGFGALGLERLRDAGRTIAGLRARSRLDLPDLVAFTVQQLDLDLEVAANDRRALGSANLDAFYDAVSGYLALDEEAGLRGFLSWLREAELKEDLSPRPEPPEPGTVQVLTVHGSKGLEWDHVVVPRLVADELPAKPREGFNGWLTFGALPWPFRGDAAELPEFRWRGAETRKDVETAMKEFKEEVKARSLAEERRLAYVAVTRARHGLLLTGSFWATQKEPRVPSVFLTDLVEAGVIRSLPEAPQSEENPLGDAAETMRWPIDPLGGRRAAVEQAAAAVRAAEPSIDGPWRRDLELLLAERHARGEGETVPTPTRVSASRFKDFVSDPDAVAATLRRPMPERPYRATQLGTLFHSWVEQRSTLDTADELDADAFELDLGDEIESEARLEELKATFEASEWASRRPVDVEREIHLPFDDRIVICKIDAVYERDGRFEIVDWKTGKAPRDAEDLEQKQLQLALYRLAYARWRGVEPALIDAVFYFVADDAVIRPERIFDEAELLERWRAAYPDV